MKSMRLAVYLLLVTSMIVLVVYQLLDGWTWVRVDKKILFPSHTDKTKNTVTWAVKLYNHSDILQTANKIASDLGLINQGPIGHLNDVYLFHYDINNKSDDLLNKTTLSDAKLIEFHQKLYSDVEMKEIIEEVEEKLNSHTDVVWHSHQKIVSRSKRSIQFQDPYYSRQWHLVRIAFSLFNTNI